MLFGNIITFNNLRVTYNFIIIFLFATINYFILMFDNTEFEYENKNNTYFNMIINTLANHMTIGNLYFKANGKLSKICYIIHMLLIIFINLYVF